MSLSFAFRPPAPGRKPSTVLITGAAGRIGLELSRALRDDFQLRLMLRPGGSEEPELCGFGEVVEVDLEDLEGLKKACQGMDVVVHLAGDPDPSAAWSSLLQSNIIGTYNVLVAAKSAGCDKVILASSIHAVSGYPRDVQVKTTDPVNPGDLYGVSKCFLEALGRYFSTQEGLPVIALRIAAFQPLETARADKGLTMLDAFVSWRDLIELIRLCIEDQRLQFALFHGLSDNRFKRLDISDARELLGFAPQDDLTEENPKLAPLNLDETVRAHSQKDGQDSGIREDL